MTEILIRKARRADMNAIFSLIVGAETWRGDPDVATAIPIEFADMFSSRQGTVDSALDRASAPLRALRLSSDM